MRGRRWFVVSAWLCASFAGVGASHAATFAPIQCSLCPTRTEVTFSYDSLSELPQDPNCVGNPMNPCPHYTNFLVAQRFVSANQFVKEFGFRVDSFQTEINDFLAYGESSGTLTQLTGAPATGWRDFSSSTGLQSSPGQLLFLTDASGGRSGFNLGRARVCCQSTPNSTPSFLL